MSYLSKAKSLNSPLAFVSFYDTDPCRTEVKSAKPINEENHQLALYIIQNKVLISNIWKQNILERTVVKIELIHSWWDSHLVQSLKNCLETSQRIRKRTSILHSWTCTPEI